MSQRESAPTLKRDLLGFRLGSRDKYRAIAASQRLKVRKNEIPFSMIEDEAQRFASAVEAINAATLQSKRDENYRVRLLADTELMRHMAANLGSQARAVVTEHKASAESPPNIFPHESQTTKHETKAPPPHVSALSLLRQLAGPRSETLPDFSSMLVYPNPLDEASTQQKEQSSTVISASTQPIPRFASPVPSSTPTSPTEKQGASSTDRYLATAADALSDDKLLDYTAGLSMRHRIRLEKPDKQRLVADPSLNVSTASSSIAADSALGLPPVAPLSISLTATVTSALRAPITPVNVLTNEPIIADPGSSNDAKVTSSVTTSVQKDRSTGSELEVNDDDSNSGNSDSNKSSDFDVDSKHVRCLEKAGPSGNTISQVDAMTMEHRKAGKGNVTETQQVDLEGKVSDGMRAEDDDVPVVHQRPPLLPLSDNELDELKVVLQERSHPRWGLSDVCGQGASSPPLPTQKLLATLGMPSTPALASARREVVPSGSQAEILPLAKALVIASNLMEDRVKVPIIHKDHVPLSHMPIHRPIDSYPNPLLQSTTSITTSKDTSTHLVRSPSACTSLSMILSAGNTSPKDSAPHTGQTRDTLLSKRIARQSALISPDTFHFDIASLDATPVDERAGDLFPSNTTSATPCQCQIQHGYQISPSIHTHQSEHALAFQEKVNPSSDISAQSPQPVSNPWYYEKAGSELTDASISATRRSTIPALSAKIDLYNLPSISPSSLSTFRTLPLTVDHHSSSVMSLDQNTSTSSSQSVAGLDGDPVPVGPAESTSSASATDIIAGTAQEGASIATFHTNSPVLSSLNRLPSCQHDTNGDPSIIHAPLPSPAHNISQPISSRPNSRASVSTPSLGSPFAIPSRGNSPLPLASSEGPLIHLSSDELQSQLQLQHPVRHHLRTRSRSYISKASLSVHSLPPMSTSFLSASESSTPTSSISSNQSAIPHLASQQPTMGLHSIASQSTDSPMPQHIKVSSLRLGLTVHVGTPPPTIDTTNTEDSKVQKSDPVPIEGKNNPSMASTPRRSTTTSSFLFHRDIVDNPGRKGSFVESPARALSTPRATLVVDSGFGSTRSIISVDPTESAYSLRRQASLIMTPRGTSVFPKDEALLPLALSRTPSGRVNPDITEDVVKAAERKFDEAARSASKAVLDTDSAAYVMGLSRDEDDGTLMEEDEDDEDIPSTPSSPSPRPRERTKPSLGVLNVVEEEEGEFTQDYEKRRAEVEEAEFGDSVGPLASLSLDITHGYSPRKRQSITPRPGQTQGFPKKKVVFALHPAFAQAKPASVGPLLSSTLPGGLSNYALQFALTRGEGEAAGKKEGHHSTDTTAHPKVVKSRLKAPMTTTNAGTSVKLGTFWEAGSTAGRQDDVIEHGDGNRDSNDRTEIGGPTSGHAEEVAHARVDDAEGSLSDHRPHTIERKRSIKHKRSRSEFIQQPSIIKRLSMHETPELAPLAATSTSTTETPTSTNKDPTDTSGTDDKHSHLSSDKSEELTPVKPSSSRGGPGAEPTLSTDVLPIRALTPSSPHRLVVESQPGVRRDSGIVLRRESTMGGPGANAATLNHHLKRGESPGQNMKRNGSRVLGHGPSVDGGLDKPSQAKTSNKGDQTPRSRKMSVTTTTNRAMTPKTGGKPQSTRHTTVVDTLRGDGIASNDHTMRQETTDSAEENVSSVNVAQSNLVTPPTTSIAPVPTVASSPLHLQPAFLNEQSEPSTATTAFELLASESGGEVSVDILHPFAADVFTRRGYGASDSQRSGTSGTSRSSVNVSSSDNSMTSAFTVSRSGIDRLSNRSSVVDLVESALVEPTISSILDSHSETELVNSTIKTLQEKSKATHLSGESLAVPRTILQLGAPKRSEDNKGEDNHDPNTRVGDIHPNPSAIDGRLDWSDNEVASEAVRGKTSTLGEHPQALADPTLGLPDNSDCSTSPSIQPQIKAEGDSVKSIYRDKRKASLSRNVVQTKTKGLGYSTLFNSRINQTAESALSLTISGPNMRFSHTPLHLLANHRQHAFNRPCTPLASSLTHHRSPYPQAGRSNKIHHQTSSARIGPNAQAQATEALNSDADQPFATVEAILHSLSTAELISLVQTALDAIALESSGSQSPPIPLTSSLWAPSLPDCAIAAEGDDIIRTHIVNVLFGRYGPFKHVKSPPLMNERQITSTDSKSHSPSVSRASTAKPPNGPSNQEALLTLLGLPVRQTVLNNDLDSQARGGDEGIPAETSPNIVQTNVNSPGGGSVPIWTPISADLEKIIREAKAFSNRRWIGKVIHMCTLGYYLGLIAIGPTVLPLSHVYRYMLFFHSSSHITFHSINIMVYPPPNSATELRLAELNDLEDALYAHRQLKSEVAQVMEKGMSDTRGLIPLTYDPLLIVDHDNSEGIPIGPLERNRLVGMMTRATGECHPVMDNDANSEQFSLPLSSCKHHLTTKSPKSTGVTPTQLAVCFPALAKAGMLPSPQALAEAGISIGDLVAHAYTSSSSVTGFERFSDLPVRPRAKSGISSNSSNSRSNTTPTEIKAKLVAMADIQKIRMEGQSGADNSTIVVGGLLPRDLTSHPLACLLGLPSSSTSTTVVASSTTAPCSDSLQLATSQARVLTKAKRQQVAKRLVQPLIRAYTLTAPNPRSTRPDDSSSSHSLDMNSRGICLPGMVSEQLPNHSSIPLSGSSALPEPANSGNPTDSALLGADEPQTPWLLGLNPSQAKRVRAVLKPRFLALQMYLSMQFAYNNKLVSRSTAAKLSYSSSDHSDATPSTSCLPVAPSKSPVMSDPGLTLPSLTLSTSSQRTIVPRIQLGLPCGSNIPRPLGLNTTSHASPRFRKPEALTLPSLALPPSSSSLHPTLPCNSALLQLAQLASCKDPSPSPSSGHDIYSGAPLRVFPTSSTQRVPTHSPSIPRAHKDAEIIAMTVTQGSSTRAMHAAGLIDTKHEGAFIRALGTFLWL